MSGCSAGRKVRNGNSTDLAAKPSETQNPINKGSKLCCPAIPGLPTILLKLSTELTHLQMAGSERETGREKGSGAELTWLRLCTVGFLLGTDVAQAVLRGRAGIQITGEDRVGDP